MGYLELISKELEQAGKELWVFKYRDGNSNNANSIIFITNIQFSDIELKEFINRYSLEVRDDAKLVRETFSQFYKKTYKLKKTV